MTEVETHDERRLRKLQALCNQHGVDQVAVHAELSPAALRQIIKGTMLQPKKDGTRKPRALGDDSARAIELAYGLGRGWFDNDAPAGALPADALAVAEAFNALSGPTRQTMFATLQNLLAMTAAMQDAGPASQTPSEPPTPAHESPHRRP